MMNEIYFIESSYSPTSASSNRLLAYAKYLLGKGVRSTFIYLIPDKNNSKCEGYDNNLKFVYLWEKSPFNNKYLNTIRSLIKLRKMMKPEVPVYVYSLLNCLTFIIKKNICVYHEYTENPEVIGVINNTVGRFLFRKYKKALKKVKSVFVITDALKEYYIQKLGVESHKIDTINMIVDTHRFENIDNVTMSNVITYCGCISESKDGVSCLIKAFGKVHLTNADYSLQIIGGFENYQTERLLKDLVKDMNLEKYVNFTGPVIASKMPALLKSSKVLALARPNNKQANFGFATKIGEYLMTGRPVVLTKVGAVEDYLTDKENCIFAKPDDVDDFADNLIWAIEHYDQAVKIGERGKLAATTYFNAEIESEKIYNRIISSLCI